MKVFLKKAWAALGLRGTIAAILLLLLLIVGLQNMEPIDIDFLFWDLIEVPKLLFIVGLSVAGFTLGVVVGWGRGRH